MILYYKMRQILLQNATTRLPQNAANVDYKMRQIYYKLLQLLQNALVLLQNPTILTNCDVYYKLRR